MNVKGISAPKFPLSSKDVSLPTLAFSINDKEGVRIKGEVVLQKTYLLDVNDYSATATDTLFELVGKQVFLQLVSKDHIDQDTGLGKKGEEESISWVPLDGPVAKETTYDVSFKWNVSDMGVPGALLVKNTHAREFFLKSVTLFDVPGKGTLRFHCNSWIYPYYYYNKTARVFFSTQGDKNMFWII